MVLNPEFKLEEGMLMKVRSLVLFIFWSACACGVGVVMLYSFLEDSPYHFNLGIQAPAGIYPDFTNRLSLNWDIIVLGSVITLFAVVACIFYLFKLLDAADVARWRVVRRRMQMCALVAAVAMDGIAAATIAWGILAHLNASFLFDHFSVYTPYLTVGSWLPLATLIALAAFVASHAVIRSWQYQIPRLRNENTRLVQKRTD